MTLGQALGMTKEGLQTNSNGPARDLLERIGQQVNALASTDPVVQGLAFVGGQNEPPPTQQAPDHRDLMKRDQREGMDLSM